MGDILMQPSPEPVLPAGREACKKKARNKHEKTIA